MLGLSHLIPNKCIKYTNGHLHKLCEYANLMQYNNDKD